MTMTVESLSGRFEDLIVKAFYVALAKFEQPIASDMDAEIGTVTIEAASDPSQFQKLKAIAKKNQEFYELYENAYLDLRDLERSPSREREKIDLTETSAESSVPENPNIVENLAAPNSQNLAKESADKLGKGFLSRVFKVEIKIGSK